jgi:hypothetical protein
MAVPQIAVHSRPVSADRIHGYPLTQQPGTGLRRNTGNLTRFRPVDPFGFGGGNDGDGRFRGRAVWYVVLGAFDGPAGDFRLASTTLNRYTHTDPTTATTVSGRLSLTFRWLSTLRKTRSRKRAPIRRALPA